MVFGALGMGWVKVKLQAICGWPHTPDGDAHGAGWDESAAFIVEQSGTIVLLLPDGTVRAAPFLD